MFVSWLIKNMSLNILMGDENAASVTNERWSPTLTLTSKAQRRKGLAPHFWIHTCGSEWYSLWDMPLKIASVQCTAQLSTKGSWESQGLLVTEALPTARTRVKLTLTLTLTVAVAPATGHAQVCCLCIWNSVLLNILRKCYLEICQYFLISNNRMCVFDMNTFTFKMLK